MTTNETVRGVTRVSAVRVYDIRGATPDSPAPLLSTGLLEAALRQRLLPEYPPEDFRRSSETRRVGTAEWPDDRRPLATFRSDTRGTVMAFRLREFVRALPSMTMVRRKVDDKLQAIAIPRAPSRQQRTELETSMRAELSRQLIPRVLETTVIVQDYGSGEMRVVLIGVSDAREETVVTAVTELLRASVSDPVVRQAPGAIRLLPRTLDSIIETSRCGVPMPEGLGTRFLGMLAAAARKWLDVEQGPCVRVEPLEDVRARVDTTDEQHVARRGTLRARGSAAVDSVKGLLESGEEGVTIERVRLKLTTPDDRSWSMTLTGDGVIRSAAVPRLEHLSRASGMEDYLALVEIADALVHAFDVGPLTTLVHTEPQRPLWVPPTPGGPSVRWVDACPRYAPTPGQVDLF